MTVWKPGLWGAAAVRIARLRLLLVSYQNYHMLRLSSGDRPVFRTRITTCWGSAAAAFAVETGHCREALPRRGLRESVVGRDLVLAPVLQVRLLRHGLPESFWGGFQAPFPPGVAHGPLLNCSYRGDRVTRAWSMGLRVRATQTETRNGCWFGWTVSIRILGRRRRLFHLSLFLTASRMVLPQDPSTDQDAIWSGGRRAGRHSSRHAASPSCPPTTDLVCWHQSGPLHFHMGKFTVGVGTSQIPCGRADQQCKQAPPLRSGVISLTGVSRTVRFR